MALELKNSKIKHIGIAGPCNPSLFSDFIYSSSELCNINNTATSVNTLVRELLHSGYKVTVFTSSFISNQIIEYTGDLLRIVVIPSHHWIKGFTIFSRLYMVRRIAKQISYYYRELDVLHAQWTYEFALASEFFADKLPVFCTIRDWCPYIFSIQNNIKAKVFWLTSLFVFKRVIKSEKINFIANSDYTFRCIKKLYPERHIHIIGNPVLKEFIIKDKDDYKCSPVFISICQSLEEPRKNIKSLLVAYNYFKKDHPESKLILIGSFSNLFIENMNSISKNIFDNVELIGQVSHKSIAHYLDLSTCLVHPSWEETFGNIFLEAMARKVVCIGGIKSGAVPQVLENGKCGILCDINDKDSLVQAMKDAHNLEYRKSLLKNATNKVLLHSSDRNMEDHINLYNRYVNA